MTYSTLTHSTLTHSTLTHSTLTRTLCRSLLLASVAFGSVAMADAPIVKCTDTIGRITLTDAGCPVSSDMQIVLGGNNAQDAQNSGASASRYTERASMALRQPVERGLAPDVATLRAAKAAFLVLDATRTPRYAQMASIN